MKDKIIQVIYRIMQSPEKIGDIIGHGGEIYFVYSNHYMSIASRLVADPKHGEYSLYFYPKWEGDLKGLADIAAFIGVDELPMVYFHETDFDTTAEKRLLRDLYKFLEMKKLGFDKIIDDILSDW